MQNIFFTSDNHYFHKNILKYTDRPFQTIEEMTESFIEWNNKNVLNTDVVWNLGDFSFGSTEQTLEVLRRLKGEHHLILGNHCKNISKNRDLFIGNNLFHSIQREKDLRIGSDQIYMHHHPVLAWENSHYGRMHLFGHIHGSYEMKGKSVDVGIDSPWITGKKEYRPFHLDEILEYMKTKPILEYSERIINE